MPDILDIFADPGIAGSLDSARWDKLLRDARRCHLLPRLTHHLPDHSGLPEPVRRQLQSGRTTGDSFERQLRWQLERLRLDLRHTTYPIVLLKGAGYLLADLPIARGRRVNDIDVMVERQYLAETESTLRQCGWESLKSDEYDDAYYRTWMHELPPLRHPQYGTVLDIHHTILPLTGRLHPDPARLFGAARPLVESELAGANWYVLSPTDLVLHAAAHMFQDGELSGSLRDLLDIDGLMRHFASVDPTFFAALIPRAVELNLQRPVYYALRYCQRLLRTPVPETTLAQADAARGSRWQTCAMDWLVVRALVPPEHPGTGTAESAALFALYIRSHWLRMPPLLLTRHLLRKATGRWKKT